MTYKFFVKTKTKHTCHLEHNIFLVKTINKHTCHLEHNIFLFSNVQSILSKDNVNWANFEKQVRYFNSRSTFIKKFINSFAVKTQQKALKLDILTFTRKETRIGRKTVVEFSLYDTSKTNINRNKTLKTGSNSSSSKVYEHTIPYLGMFVGL